MTRKQSKFARIFKQFDCLGSRIELNYKGKGTFKTPIGAIFTFVLGALLIYLS